MPPNLFRLVVIVCFPVAAAYAGEKKAVQNRYFSIDSHGSLTDLRNGKNLEFVGYATPRSSWDFHQEDERWLISHIASGKASTCRTLQ